MNVMSKMAVGLSDREGLADRDPVRTERHRLRVQAHGRANQGGTAEFVIHDISTHGLLVETSDPLHAGDIVEVDLLHAVSSPARIVWSSGPFYGCSFLEPIPDALVRNVLLRDAAWSSGRPRDGERNDSIEDWATKIVRLRQSHGLTSEEFASRIGVSRQAVWYWETGQRNPRAEQIRKIREKFGHGDENASRPREAAEEPVSTASFKQYIADCKRTIAERLGVDDAQIRVTIDW